MFALAAFAGTALSAVITNITVATGPTPLPSTKQGFWTLAIAGATPLIVGLIYRLVPKIPKVVVPSITPVVGIGLGLLINWLGTKNLSWVDMAQAGALAVFVREVFTNAVTNQLAAPVSTVPAPPAG